MNYQKLFIIAFVAIFAIGASAQEWKALDGTRSISELQVKVLEKDSTQTTLEITVPGYMQKKAYVNGVECLKVYMPKQVNLNKKGFPELPRLGTLVKIDDYSNVKVEVIEKIEEEIAIESPIKPARGYLTRNINPSSVPLSFGSIYETDEFWPKRQIRMGKPFILRDVRGVALQVLPFTVNHVQKTMRVMKKLVVSIKNNGMGTFNVRMRRRKSKPEKVFQRVYAHSFANYEEEETNTRTPNMPSTKVKLLVLYPNAYADTVLNSTWLARRQDQYPGKVTTKNIHELSSSPTNTDIKNYIQGLYDEGELGYVVLVGDVDVMPTNYGPYEGAASDRLYVLLEGNDNYPDAFVSRFSGSTAEVAVQMAKVVSYETAASGDWLKHAVVTGSKEGSPTDQTRCGWLINGDGGGVEGTGLHRLGYDTFTENYTNGYSSSMKQNIADAVNNGVSLMFYIGHGTETAWYSTGFSNTDISNLTNSVYPVIWSVACVNGKFTRDECFAEAWLRKENGGAVFVEASSTNEAWVPPCHKQVGTLNAMRKGNLETTGAAELAGLLHAFEVYNDGSEAIQLMEQCNLFGDCTMEIRFKK